MKMEHVKNNTSFFVYGNETLIPLVYLKLLDNKMDKHVVPCIQEALYESN